MPTSYMKKQNKMFVKAIQIAKKKSNRFLQNNFFFQNVDQKLLLYV